MFMCQRCGSSYSASRAASLENCPRCQIRDRVASPLSFKMFDLTTSGAAGSARGSALPTLAEETECQSPQPAPPPSRQAPAAGV